MREPCGAGRGDGAKVAPSPGPASPPSEVVLLIRVRPLLTRGGKVPPVDFRRSLAGVAAEGGHPRVERRVAEQGASCGCPLQAVALSHNHTGARADRAERVAG